MLEFMINILNFSNDNQEIIENFGFLKILLINFKENINNMNKDLFELKINFISLFDIREVYSEKIDLSLEILQLLNEILILKKEIIMNEENNEILKNIIKILSNISFCSDINFINNFLNYNIIQFLLEMFSNKISSDTDIIHYIIIIFGNLACSPSEISMKLYNYGIINFLINIIFNKNIIIKDRNISLWALSNFFSDELILNIIFETNFDIINKFFDIFNKNYFEIQFFGNFSLCLRCLIKFSNENYLKILIQKYNLIDIILKLNFLLISEYNKIHEMIEYIPEGLELINELIIYKYKDENYRKEISILFINNKISELFNKIKTFIVSKEEIDDEYCEQIDQLVNVLYNIIFYENKEYEI